LADKSNEPVDQSRINPGTSINALLDITSQAGDDEAWAVSEGPVLENVTNTSSIVLPDGTILMYYAREGAVWRVTSTDGVKFSDPVSTGVVEDSTIPYEQRPVIGSPGVLQLTSNKFLMVYEQSARQRPEVPQVDQPRNLYSAVSTDGLAFEKSGIVLDSVQNDGGFAVDPELLLLPDGTIRLFYSSKGDRISSLISEDGGKQWVREGERLSRITSDPDVQYFGSHYAMYYSFPSEGITRNGQLDTAQRIRKAVSEDGLTFVKTAQTVVAGPNMTNTVDPDVIVQSDGTIRMYFGLVRAGSDVADPTYDLYSATAKQGSPGDN
jgi:hypothetical protein